ncbi:MFS general substrate transporter [Dichomitus squalens]|uniref:MFS general substrate transporter n=2 Tax=Dichomitus squalens TaxID=114155 RepID=A0A4Q9PHR6_9APHY|nr:MFS general substrate transporter [Dichomitus squalens LYAD-421 SS1]EJF56926.1 MFS general substrate transporter [Dichomitus squalens LYAD-421 SS1]TBU40662.1 MFS general substrate transporter [Dichomitus squalens]TBU53477.1 MFS general substrate transporter [Dichomitus squalens]
MQGFRLPSTILNLSQPRRFPSVRDGGLQDRVADETTISSAVDEEVKLPKLASLVIVIISNVLLQITFFIIVSSSNDYARHLGGSSTFSGLVIGIPTAVSGVTLLPLMRLDQGGYKRPIHVACASMVVGNILYGLAYRANWLYLILLGRMVCGCGFTFWMYNKRYCSDPRIVGLRRRTTLAGWLVLGQGVGFSSGPFFGGLLFKVGFNNSIFNGYTSPAWVMAACWVIFWIAVGIWFEDVPRAPQKPVALRSMPAPSARETDKDDKREATPSVRVAESEDAPAVSRARAAPIHKMTPQQWGVSATMCWFAMTTFFILGAWESNIPVFTSSRDPANPFHFSPFAAGNLIALGGACTIPFLLLNLGFARRVQDRHTLALGTSLGTAGLLIAMAVLRTHTVSYGTLWLCWFLVALGFNVASTVTLSLLSKQLPGEWNGRISLFIQWSNYTGRVTGAVWGGSGVKVGMLTFVGVQLAYVGIGTVMFTTLWRHLKAKTG